MPLKVDIEKIKNILLDYEHNKVYEFHAIVETLSRYGVNQSISPNKPDDVSTVLEDVFIRCLASDATSPDFPNFSKILDELSNANSKLINYLIARHHKADSKTLFKIFTSNNYNEEILSEITKNTDDPILLEEIYNNGNMRNKIEVLNKESFKLNPKAQQYYLDAFDNFTDHEFEQIRETKIPVDLKDIYKEKQRIHYLHSYIEELTQTYESYLNTNNEDILFAISSELNQAKEEYAKITNTDLKI